jgi:hypothetical protein
MGLFVEHYRAWLIFAGIVGGVAALWAYGSYAGYDDSGIVLLAITGALSGVAYWLLFINDYLGTGKK